MHAETAPVSDEEACKVRTTREGRPESHCDCWWDGEPCCVCGAPADPHTCKECGASDCEDHVEAAP